MEFGPDSERNTEVRFIASYAEVFSGSDVVLPTDHCNLVAVAPKYGLVFVACGTVFKVFSSKMLTDGQDMTALSTVNTGATITHVAVSCDGLTLLVFIINNSVPHALFYDVRNFGSGGKDEGPFTSVCVSPVVGSRLTCVACNPGDPNSVAVVAAPSTLTIVTLTDSQATAKSVSVTARAVGWSMKGKQMTVGLTDGSLRLLKPDLTPVRSVPKPTMEGVGSVLSITWFTNTEFFISYELMSEEGAHVMMYVNAPKAKEPKFVAYEYLCNYNQGPRPPMFYPAFFPEWSLLCLLSSRAIQVAVLGRPAAGGEGWCEYEIEEGGCAEVHIMSVTDETFPMGLAVDFTSQKMFMNKDQTTSGPFPVIYTLSTGGELNIFHLVNSKPGVPALTKACESLPSSGHRTTLQYKGTPSYTVPKPGITAAPPTGMPSLNIPSFTAPSFPSTTNITTPAAPPPAYPSIPSIGAPAAAAPTPVSFTATAPAAASGSPFSMASAGFFKSAASQPSSVPAMGSQTTSIAQPTAVDSTKQSFSFSLPSASPFTVPASTTSSAGSGSGGSIFGGKLTTPSPSKPSIAPEAPAPLPSSIPKPSLPTPQPAPPMGGSTLQFSMSSPAAKPEASGGQSQSFQAFQLPQANTSAGSISQGKPAINPISSPAFKPTALTPDKSKLMEKQTNFKPQTPTSAVKSAPSFNNSDASLLATIASATSQFEDEMKDHVKLCGLKNMIGSPDEMSEVRVSVSSVCEWTGLMSGTTSELKGEVTQLHSEVLEGYTLAEEARVAINKTKNPRHNVMPTLRPLDPHSRRQLDDIRSIYQYLGSQLVEVETRLHLDWATFSNDRNKKKKHELPASETLYQALKKCHNLRRVCEKRVDTLCDRIKTLNLNYLSGLSNSHSKYDDDESLAMLERSLRETSISPASLLSPFKMLSPQKQDKLERVMAQRQVIPIRKCSSIPKADLTCMDLSSVCSQDGSSDSASPTPAQHSFSFGPETYSTPNRDNLIQNSFKSSWETTRTTTGAGFGSGEPETSGFAPASSFGSKPQGSTFVPKPQYEDITPPQTPDNKLETGLKTASPLLALSSLVSKVPKTTGTVTSTVDVKPALGDSSNVLSGGTPKTQIISTSVPTMPNFTFKPVTSAPSVSKESSVPFSFTPFVPAPNTGLDASEGTTDNLTSQSKPSHATSSGIVFKAPSSATLSVVSTDSSQPSINPSGLFSFKPPASATITNTSVSVGDGSILSSKLGTQSETSSDSDTPSKRAFSSPAGSILSFTLTSDSGRNAESDAVGSVESDSTSSGDSDSASNNTVVDNASCSGASESAEGQDSAREGTPENQLAASLPESTISEGEETEEFGHGSTLHAILKSSKGVTPTGSLSTSSVSSEKPSALSGSSVFSSTGATSIFAKAMTKGVGIAGTTSSSPSIFGGGSGGLGTSAPSLFASPSFSSTSSLFGGAASSGSLFGGSSTTTTTTTVTSITTGGGILGTSSGSLFKTAGASNLFGTSTSTASAATSTLFGGSTASSPGSTLGTESTISASVSTPLPSASTTAATTTTAGEITSGTSTDATVTTSTTTGGFFATTKTTASIFNTSTTSTTPGSIFGTSATAGGSLFGSITTSASAGASSSSTAKSLFGGTSAISGNLFGSTPSATVSSSSTTDSAAASTLSSTGTATTVTTSASYFGQSTSDAGSLFGGATSTSTPSTGSLSSTTSTTPSGTFGQPSTFSALATSSSGSAFSSLTSSSSGFTAAATTSAAPSGTSSFGQSALGGQGSVFVTPATTASVFSSGSGSVFGNSTGSTGLFGGSAPQSSATSVFGQAGSTSVFSSGTSGGSLFGQTSSAAAASPFSSTSAPKQESSPFGTAGFGSGGSGGGFFTGLGGKPSGDNADKNVFGSTAPAGNTTPTNIFGGSSSTSSSPFGGGSVFGGNSGGGGSVFGGGSNSGDGGGSNTFSTGGGSVAQSGFAVAAPQSPSAFGGASTFGGGATIGGASPGFGGSATFSSPSKMGSSTFGGNPTFSSPLAASPGGGGGGGFGSFGSQGGSTFGNVPSPAASVAPTSGFSNFASQSSAASFGGLAQQTANQQQQQQSGSAFGSGGNVFGGGSSFSSWR